MKVDLRHSKYSMLFVEDNAINIKILTLCLVEIKDLIITVALPGKEALINFNASFGLILR